MTDDPTPDEFERARALFVDIEIGAIEAATDAVRDLAEMKHQIADGMESGASVWTFTANEDSYADTTERVAAHDAFPFSKWWEHS